MPDAPLLALPGGSVLQFLLMTLPLLGVYLYFLWLALDRPNLANPNDPRYSEDRIRLTDILYTYLATLLAFAGLAFYLLWFVRRRRALSLRYSQEAVTVLGDVEYDHSDNRALAPLGSRLVDGLTRRTDYGRVVYDLARVANHPACDYEARRGKKLTGTVTKKVRVYYRYPRERVSLLVLPRHPQSGQPQLDMEADWATFAEPAGGEDGGTRDHSRGVLVVSLGWIMFLLLASLYVTVQIAVVEDYYDDEDGRWAWTVFWSGAGGGIAVAIGGNFLRWKVYEHWMLAGGTTKRPAKKKMSRRRDSDSDDDGSYLQMT